MANVEAGESAGFLTDREIRVELEAGRLIDRGSWNPEGIRHASYTLRLGDRVEVARASSSAAAVREFVVVRISPGQAVQLQPGDTALLFSIEHLRFPANMLGLTVARGLFFAEALTPENTYVDPGFAGSLYTTVVNNSNRIIRLDYGTPIARLFFFRLTHQVEEPYRPGVAQGISQQLASVRSDAAGSSEECRDATDAQLISAIRTLPLCGNHIIEMLERHGRLTAQYRNRTNERLVMITAGAFVWPILVAVVGRNEWLLAQLGVFGVSVAASLVAAAIAWMTGVFTRRWRR